MAVVAVDCFLCYAWLRLDDITHRIEQNRIYLYSSVNLKPKELIKELIIEDCTRRIVTEVQ